MFMRQNGTAYNRQIGIRAYEIVGELLYKIQKLSEGIVIDSHRGVLSIKHNTMLIIVNVRGVLEAPFAVVYCNGNNSVVLSGWEVKSACIPLALLTKHALRIA